MHTGEAIVVTCRLESSVKYKNYSQSLKNTIERKYPPHGVMKVLKILFILLFQVGLRRRTYTVLSGSVLAVWQRVETQLAARVSSNNRMQVIRLKTSDGNKIVGILVPKVCVESLITDLKRDAEKVEEKTFTH